MFWQRFRPDRRPRPGGRRATRTALRALFPAVLGMALVAPAAEAAPPGAQAAPAASGTARVDTAGTDNPRPPGDGDGHADGDGSKDRLGRPTVTRLGTFGGIRYLRYDGVFEGRTSTGRFRVPYRISAPADPHRGNGTVLVEPPHFAAGLGTLDSYLEPKLLFSRGFVHAGVGWSTFRNRILDPSVPGTFIEGGFLEDGERVDDEIVTEFGRALLDARRKVGKVRHRYVTGFSDSSYPVLRLIKSGAASGVFDLAMPFTTDTFDPQTDMATGRYRGKVVVVNSEADDSSTLIDRGVLPHRYRFYVVAGTPHVPDLLAVPPALPGLRGSTPATFVPALRAHFLQGHDWVRKHKAPPTSTQLETSRNGTVLRDDQGNAFTEDRTGRRVPRLPFVELGEARYIPGFIGSYDNVRTVGQLGFRDHAAYLEAFHREVRDYLRAGYILPEDAKVMRKRAALCPPSTYTETYRDHYDEFLAVTPCAAAR
ncbi:alpha/beta hydrolase domain-containing protein [Streptomyces coeruleoprunus]|uniref:Alpha/beta hydrolase domain-containing protein n=1 Tax=Streptomyces coeruleoprunus TaxID=285563 RepID=A0ABV9X873_9ACTN